MKIKPYSYKYKDPVVEIVINIQYEEDINHFISAINQIVSEYRLKRLKDVFDDNGP